ncbi:TPA: hypothetical protein QCY56_005665 [Bacillus toyonensis]|nr:hypothetical protein [Bacillus toyonensis]
MITLKDFRKLLCLVSAFVLVFTFFSIPAKEVFASDQLIESVVEDEELMQKAENVLKSLVFLKDENKISIDVEKAKSFGLNDTEIANAKSGFESFTVEDVTQFQNVILAEENEKPWVIIVAIPLSRVITALVIAGLGWIAKEILTFGAYQVCKKWKYKHWMLRDYCNAKRW